MNTIKPPYLLRLFTSNFLLWKIKTNSKKIYLTFDDGPTPKVTTEVLSILSKFGVKATFFCIGKKVQENQELFKSIKESGHRVGNHTFNHIDGWKTMSKNYVADIEKAQNFIDVKLFRPPYGRITPSQYLQLRKHYIIVMWSIMAGDFDKNKDKHTSLSYVIKYSNSGSIVVFHDSAGSAEKCFYILPRFIEYFLTKGYNFELL